MFAKPTDEKTLEHIDEVFYRFVKPVTSHLDLMTIVKLLNVQLILIGEIDEDEINFIPVESDITKKAIMLIKAIVQGENRQEAYNELRKYIKGKTLYMTVFAIEGVHKKSHTLVLATAPNDKRVKYLRVKEDDLLKATSILEV